MTCFVYSVDKNGIRRIIKHFLKFLLSFIHLHDALMLLTLYNIKFLCQWYLLQNGMKNIINFNKNILIYLCTLYTERA